MFRSAFAVAAILAFSILPAVAENEVIWMEYPEAGAVLGQGYNLLEDRPATGTCVRFVPIQDPSQSVQYRFDEVTSSTQVKSSTNISASGSMKMAILKATARLSFLSDETFKLETEKFLLSASVVNSSLFAAPSIDFKKGGEVVTYDAEPNSDSPGYASMSSIVFSDDADKFNVEKCGQGFIAAIVSGASLDAFLTMSKTDAASLAQIKGSLEAEIAGIFSVSGSFDQQQSSAAIQQNTSVSVYKSGGSGGQIAYDLPGLKATVAAMPLEAATTPKPIRVAILPYKFLDLAPKSKSYSARLFEQGVAAYFLARDVFQNTGSVIDRYEAFSEDSAVAGQPIFLERLSTYVALNAAAMRSTNRLSTVLELCQAKITAAEAPPEKEDDGADVVETKSVETKLWSSLGVTPEEEDYLQPHTFSIEGSADGIATLLTEKSVAVTNAFDKAVTELTSTRSESESEPDWIADQLKSCDPEIDTAYFSVAVEEAILLAARELSVRPIFWSELDTKHTEALGKVAEQVGGAAIPDQLIAQAKPHLEEFADTYRTLRLLRDICSTSFTHPLCATPYEYFAPLARPAFNALNVDLQQLKLDAERSGAF